MGIEVQPQRDQFAYRFADDEPHRGEFGIGNFDKADWTLGGPSQTELNRMEERSDDGDLEEDY